MFFEKAYAQAGEQSSFSLVNLLPILLIFVIFYFLLFRPQQKKEKVRQEMLNRLQRGDKIVTSGGIIGTIHRIGDKELSLEIAEGVRISILRSTIVEVYSKEPGSPKANDASEKSKSSVEVSKSAPGKQKDSPKQQTAKPVTKKKPTKQPPTKK